MCVPVQLLASKDTSTAGFSQNGAKLLLLPRLEMAVSAELRQHVFYFGAYEFDSRTLELRKMGLRLKLQQQPARILALLLERPGEVVTREELRSQLWPTEVYVDFDRGLNKAMVKLRDALSDSADSPRYIETLPRIGYRFIGPITRPAPPAETDHGVLVFPQPAEGPVGTKTNQRRKLWSVAWAVALFVLAIAGLLTWKLLRPSRAAMPISIRQLTNTPEGKTWPLVTDGARIYFPQTNGGPLSPAEVSVAGGEVSPLVLGKDNADILDISADGATMLIAVIQPGYSYNGPPELWIAPVIGRTPRRLGNIRTNFAAFSPDARSIAFESGQDLYVVDLAGEHARKLLTAPARIHQIRWSPDGTRLRFDVGGKNFDSFEIWEVSANGGTTRPVLPGHNACCGNWSRSGQSYVFESSENGRRDIWLIHGDSASPQRVTSGPLDMTGPVFSRDENTIFAIGEQREGELVRYNASRREFEPLLGGISVEDVTYSRDGKWVAWVAYPEGTLWRSRSDGSERLQLTFPGSIASVPQWSPDARRLAYVSSGHASARWKTYVVSADGGTPERLLPASADEYDEFSPWWSRDGRFIVVGGLPSQQWLDGIHMVEVATHRDLLMPNTERLCCPTWSAYSDHLFAIAVQPPRLMDYDPATRTWSELWRGSLNYYVESHDGKYLYFDTQIEANPAIYRLRLSDRKLERVAGLENVRRVNGSIGRWFDLTPDDSPMLLRNIGSRQIYAIDLQSK